MAVITPNTDLYLLKVPLEINDINQLDFSNATAQFNYFNSLPKLAVDDFTYQRKDNTVRFPAQYDEIITYNYCMYRNTEYSDKWFYAFITNMEYVNDNMTMITIKTDVWQCWQFDLTYKPCLIDREHTNDDTVGNNTLPESLELGEMTTNGAVINFGGSTTSVIMVEVSQVENTGDGGSLSYEWEDESAIDYDKTPYLNGLLKGTIPLLIEYNSVDAPSFDEIRSIYERAGLSDAIINVYPLPRVVVTYDGANIGGHNLTLKYTDTFGSVLQSVEHVKILSSSYEPSTPQTHNFSKPESLGNFVPENKKLLTYPFCYFNISNNAGASYTYHYEDFYSSNIAFQTSGVICVGGSMKAMPLSYKRLSANENSLDFSVTGAKYPIASWKSDSYTNWLTQNAVNMDTQWKSTLVSAGVDLFGGMILGKANPLGGGIIGGAIAGGIGAAREIISTAREQHLAKTRANFVPDQVQGNINAGDFVWSKYRSPFTYIPMCIKPEYARCIDEYFSQFGYKCNRVKLPNIRGRRNWNYVKTVGCYIQGDIPQNDLNEIKAMFDNGITIWHNPLYFADYSQNNDII